MTEVSKIISCALHCSPYLLAAYSYPLLTNAPGRMCDVTPRQNFTLVWLGGNRVWRPLQVTLKVGMSCQGCVGAVERVLKKMPGVSVSRDLAYKGHTYVSGRLCYCAPCRCRVCKHRPAVTEGVCEGRCDT